jgi:hypothetical protein
VTAPEPEPPLEASVYGVPNTPTGGLLITRASWVPLATVTLVGRDEAALQRSSDDFVAVTVKVPTFVTVSIPSAVRSPAPVYGVIVYVTVPPPEPPLVPSWMAVPAYVQFSGVTVRTF